MTTTKMKKLFLSFIVVIHNVAIAQVLIMTHACNRPEFIEIQYKTFKKFLKDDYEFVVFNDARDPKIRITINQICSTLGLRSIEIPQEVHDRPYLYRNPGEDYNNANARCANVVQYSLDQLGFDHDGLVMIIDSDMFLIKEFSVVNFLQGSAIAGVPQSWDFVHYLWNGLVFFNMNELPDKKTINFNCGWVEKMPTDVGGFVHYYLKAHADVIPKCIDVLHSDSVLCCHCQKNKSFVCKHNTDVLKSLSFDDEMIKLMQSAHNIEFLLQRTFLHYRGGTNWDLKQPKYHKAKFKLVNDFINNIIA